MNTDPERVVRLEVEAEHVRRELDALRLDQREARAALGRIEQADAARPTRMQFWIMIGLSAILVLTVIGFVVGGLAALIAGFGALLDAVSSTGA
jgi:uncharacterized membrane protein